MRRPRKFHISQHPRAFLSLGIFRALVQSSFRELIPDLYTASAFSTLSSSTRCLLISCQTISLLAPNFCRERNEISTWRVGRRKTAAFNKVGLGEGKRSSWMWWVHEAHSRMGKFRFPWAQQTLRERLPEGILGCILQAQTHLISILTILGPCVFLHFRDVGTKNFFLFPLSPPIREITACIRETIETGGNWGIRTAR